MAEEYQLVPVSHSKRVEKAMPHDATRKLLDVMSENQALMSQLIKKIDDMIEKLAETASAREATGAGAEDHRVLEERISKLEKRVNMLIATIVKQTRRPAQPQPAAWPQPAAY